MENEIEIEMEMEHKPNLLQFISYCCDKCNYKTKCIIDIERHTCNQSNLGNSFIEEIGQLKFLLYLEKFKNKMYVNIIKRNTTIDLDDININDMEKEMVICNEIKNNIPLFFHDCKDKSRINKTTENETKIIESENNKKQHNRYRPIKLRNNSDEVECKSESKNDNKSESKSESKCESKSENKQIEISNLREENNDINIDDIQQEFTDILNNIEQTTRAPNKYLSELKNKRLLLFSNFQIQDYSAIIQKHINILENIFKKKDLNDKKIKNLIMKSLSPLESRLISYSGYHNTCIEVDEMDMLMQNISKSNNITEYIPFNINIFIKKLSNYSCALFTIDNLINNLLFNSNGFNNYIFVNVTEKISDPYSFYYLEKIVKGKRHWKMDCRLENLSSNFINIILPYMITMFRKLYKDTFQDNDYRSNYNTFSQLTELDCEQLFKNIFNLGHHKKFRKYLINKIITKSTYIPTEDDKFNLTGDDSLQKKRLKNEPENDFGEIIKQLFDNISFDNTVELYNNKKISYSN